MHSAESFIDAFARWASSRKDALALLLVGSRARGTAGPGSDIDLVLLCSDPSIYLSDSVWLSTFGLPERVDREDWGLLQALRVFYGDGPKVELCVGTAAWAARPPPPGTMEVLAAGAVLLLDRTGFVSRLLGRRHCSIGELPRRRAPSEE